ncbi:hypothetical protein DYQ86_22235 [Acidobacteria bacterium AB60]|nr:hypothetical protein DYQ86_22235 [Acidobacteria bacterium AB60]
MPVSETRTKWAEEQTEVLLSIPFISEFVFRSPQNLEGPRNTQREVADLLIDHMGRGLLVSQKAQEDPESRNDRRNELWVLKNAKGAVDQLIGALRSPTTPFWCDHPRRGRVDYVKGLPTILHGVVVAETFRPVDLQSSASDLPLEYTGIPITYLSINDFLNLAMQLRTVPELYAYLTARRALPESVLRRFGQEQVLLEYFLLQATFDGCLGHEDASEMLVRRAYDRNEVLNRMMDYRRGSAYLEYVTDALATRSATCLDGISARWAAAFDPTESRSNYLRMQEILSDLTLRERAMLGENFEAVIHAQDGREEGYVHSAVRLDSKPEWVFLFASSKGISREGIFRRIEKSMGAAMAFYGKARCMVVVDRDGAGFEVAVTRSDVVYVPTSTDVQLGKELFGHLRNASVVVDGY